MLDRERLLDRELTCTHDEDNHLRCDNNTDFPRTFKSMSCSFLTKHRTPQHTFSIHSETQTRFRRHSSRAEPFRFEKRKYDNRLLAVLTQPLMPSTHHRTTHSLINLPCESTTPRHHQKCFASKTKKGEGPKEEKRPPNTFMAQWCMMQICTTHQLCDFMIVNELAWHLDLGHLTYKSFGIA